MLLVIDESGDDTGAVLADQHDDDWIIARRYLTDTSLAELDNTRDTDTTPGNGITIGT
jgi:hypothetical protein